MLCLCEVSFLWQSASVMCQLLWRAAFLWQSASVMCQLLWRALLAAVHGCVRGLGK
jgi:hypothetical protein